MKKTKFVILMLILVSLMVLATATFVSAGPEDPPVGITITTNVA